MVARRANREPLACIVGHKEFYSLDLEVTHAVLIPRPETEILVAAAIETLSSRREASVLDIGTGSGAIAIAIAANAPNARVIATDVSVDALAVAKRNVSRSNLGGRIGLVQADCFKLSSDSLELGEFDLIVSNPPYIEDSSIADLELEIRAFEPHLALSGGPDGLDFYRQIAAGARGHLNPGGELIVEVGAGHSDDVIEIFERFGLRRISVLNDFAGLPRVVCARNELA
jgi:release factor glutamine methyltransferase